ncbi:MAG: PA0069 family radical SAM protein [Deltaproteobacteria bacterium]|nr:MAG: PA0069 family radical SAM protein [Deltaproteobacteria bacterium]
MEPPKRPRRGTRNRPPPRYQETVVVAEADGWALEPDAPPDPRTEVTFERTGTIVTTNDSPDVPFDRSINPYRGCEHGCIYCYARPSHAYLDLSPGIDFETRIVAKAGAAAILERTFRRRGYAPRPIALGANTDPYQPAERKLRITRDLLRVFHAYRHPVTIVTKSAMVVRDADLLADLAREGLAHVLVSITSLDPDLALCLEPRAAAPGKRLRALARLAEAGVPVGVLVSPIVPAVNDGEIEAILSAARDAGARAAGTILLRLPREVGPLFEAWLDEHRPKRKARVLSLLRQARGGRLTDARFGHRMRGEGPYAELLRARFRTACARLGLDRDLPPLSCDRFAVPPVPLLTSDPQLHLPLADG